MACEGNRGAFFTQVSAPGSAAAQAFGGPEAAKQALDDLFAIGRGGAKPPAEAKLAEAQTRLMFTQMQRRSIKPPTHSTSGLPKPDAQFGYALVQRTLTALERGEPLPPQARDLFLARQRERQIINLRADARGRVRCGSCGEFASPIRGHTCKRTANVAALRRCLVRRLGVPPSAYGDDQLATLLDAARQGDIVLRHPATGETVRVTLDALPMALGSGFVPDLWAEQGRRVVTVDGAVLTVLDGTGMQTAPAPADPIVAAATASGLHLTPDMPLVMDVPIPSALPPASIDVQARDRAAALGFDEGAQLLIKNAVRLGKVPPDQVEDVLQFALVRAVLDDQQRTIGKIATASLLREQHDRADLERIAAGSPSSDQRDAALVLRLLDSNLAPTILRANDGEALTADEERQVFELAGIDGRAEFTRLAVDLRANWEERLRLVRGLTEPETLIARNGSMWAVQLPDGSTLRYPSRKRANDEIDRSWRTAFDANSEVRRMLLDRVRLLPNRWVDAAMSGDDLPEPIAPPPPPPNPAAESFAYGSDPTRAYAMRYRVIDLDDLVPSNLDSGAINPAYDTALQPRQRDRVASQMQIAQVAKTLTPDALLTDFKQLDKGTPILGPEDRCVESGNGRVLALRKAREAFPAQWGAYQSRLRDKAGAFGIDPSELEGMRSPILVRERIDRVDRAAFAREANAPPVLQMSTLENAVVDAKRLTDDTLLRLNVREDQSIDLALRAKGNAGFVRDFIQTLPENERATLMRADGTLNQQGIWRIKAALFTRTFPGDAGRRLAETFTEALDSTTKNFEQATAATLPQLVRAQSRIGSGQRSADLDMSADIAASLDMLARLREQDMPVAVYLEQSNMFERELTPFQETMLRHFDKIGRSPKAIRGFLSAYAEAIEDAPHPDQVDMFGGGGMTKEQLFFRIAGQEAGSTPAAAAA
jgi:hypothetical protein